MEMEPIYKNCETKKSNCSVFEPMINVKKTSKNLQQQHEGKKIYQYIATLIAGLMAVQSGMNLSWTSPTGPFITSKDSFFLKWKLNNSINNINISDINNNSLDERELMVKVLVSEDEMSWVCSLMPLGAVFGAIPSGKLADHFGRKLTLILTAIPFLISWLMIILTKDLNILYIARVFGGIGSGIGCVLVPVYLGEIAESSIRGAIESFFPLLFSIGVLYVNVIGACVDYVQLNIYCLLLLLPFILTVYYLPESPIWLVQKGNIKNAEKSLKILRGKNYECKKEITLLQEEVERVNNTKGGIRDLIFTIAGRKALWTCIGLMWFQQMCGVDAVLFYTVKIFKDAGSSVNPFVAAIIISIIEVFMAMLVASVIDKFGRKPLLIISGIAMTICLGVLGYYFKLINDNHEMISFRWLPLTCLSCFNVVFSLGYGSVPFAVISELFPPETKGVAISLSITLNWFLVFIVTKFFATMNSLAGSAVTFWLFGLMAAISAVFAYIFVPETKGKTLQEIQSKLSKVKKIILTTEIA